MQQQPSVPAGSSVAGHVFPLETTKQNHSCMKPDTMIANGVTAVTATPCCPTGSQPKSITPTAAARRLCTMALMLLLLLGLTQAGWGQGSLGSYSTTGLSGTTAPTAISPTSVVSNISFSTLTRGSGLTPVAIANGFRSRGWQTGTFNIANNDYYEFTITPSSCYSISLSTIRFDLGDF